MKIWALLLTFLLAVSAGAQVGVTVSGVLQDPTGAVIPDETVSLVNKANGQIAKTTSDGEGNFRFTNVAPGDYLLRGVAEGFKTTDIPLTVGSRALSGIELSLPLLATEEEVEVRATSSQPTAADNNADAVQFNVDLIDALPSQSQDILPVLSNFLAPAAQGPEGPSIVVDGVEGSDLDLPTESIKRINLNHNPYSPEFRRPGLGRIEVTTRNGSRGHFDGTFASYVRNDALDARNHFADQKPPLDRRLFEGSLGGPFPIRHARFFVSASRLMDDESAIVNATTLQGPVIQNVPTFRDNTNVLARLDLRPNPSNTVSLVYNFHDSPEDDRGVGGLQLPAHQTSRDDRRQRGQFWYTGVISPTTINVLRFSYMEHDRRDGIPALAPEIHVNGAFTDGPSQSSQTSHERKMEFQDILSLTRGSHTFRIGGAVRPRSFTFNDASNFGGIFTFPSLATFSAGTPALFDVFQGNPRLTFSLNEAYGFVQDDMKLGSHTSLMLGLRYDWQQHLRDHNNLAPRVALGFAPGNGKTVLRVGGGVFYDRIPDSVFEQTLLLDGVNARELIVSQPSFPNPSLEGVPPSVWLLARKIQAPYLIQTSASVERSLPGGLRATLEYQYLRGVHLFRARDSNTPIDGVRPDPSFFLERQVEPTASLRSNALIASLQGRIAKKVKMKAQYTLARSDDDTDGPQVLPANSRDLGAEWGRSAFDLRHRFTFAATADLPWRSRVGALLTANSGVPFNITTGFDDNGDGIVNDRPPGIGRNTGNGPHFAQLDLRLAKSLYLFQGNRTKDGKGSNFTRMEISVDAFNIFNHTNLTDVIGVTSSSRFGLATGALQPRTIQLSVKFDFRANAE
jgi:carboxypeptidase family protein/TonB-dependent receptor-like protein